MAAGCGNVQEKEKWEGGIYRNGSIHDAGQEDERNGNLEDNNWRKSSQCYLLFANGWREPAGVLLDGDVAWWQQGVLLDGGAIQWQWGVQRTLKEKVGEWKILKWEYPKKMRYQEACYIGRRDGRTNEMGTLKFIIGQRATSANSYLLARTSYVIELLPWCSCQV